MTKMLPINGADVDVLEALRLLTAAYIHECGISLSYRTVVYNAAEEWQERLAWMDLQVSEIARKEPFFKLMPYISEEYIPEIYDKYDIIGMSDNEMIDCCREIVEGQEFDENTLAVLSWGIQHRINRKEFQPVIIEVSAPNGTYLKGVLTRQCCAYTSIIVQEPFYDLELTVNFLERKPESLLMQGYHDYVALMSREEEIRTLYARYKAALGHCIENNESSWKKMCLFRKIFGEIEENTTIGNLEGVLAEKFGLEFFIPKSLDGRQ